MKIGILMLAACIACGTPCEAPDAPQDISIRAAIVDSIDEIQTVYRTSEGSLWATENAGNQAVQSSVGQGVGLVFDQHDTSAPYDDEIIGVYDFERQILVPIDWDIDYETYFSEGDAPW